MTKDKAIAELIRIWHSPHLDLSLKAALAEAIETLKENNLNDALVRDEADDCKESESKLDLISRSDAIDACCRGWNNTAEDCIRNIKALPSAEARPTGEWIFNTNTSNGKSWNVCSECGDSIFHPANFCPNCGARMLGEDGDEE